MNTEKLEACPFCHVEPEAHDGDYVVRHQVDCFFTQQYEQEMWLVGRRRIEHWNTRHPASPEPTCEWKPVGAFEYWDTGCGRAFTLTDCEQPTKHYTFCPGCGRRLVVSGQHAEPKPTDGQMYAVVLRIWTESILGQCIANTDRPYLIPVGMERQARNALSKIGNYVIIGTKEWLMSNGFDLCPEDFDEPLEIPAIAAAMKEGKA